MVAVLSGQFSSFIDSCVIVDCRYPYEYEGGHIKVRTAAAAPQGLALPCPRGVALKTSSAGGFGTL